MDYKEKYERIVQRCKELYDVGNALTKIQMGIVCPELCESEDERIRKEMIDYFNQYKDDGLRGVDITPWIAYLEKQKEQPKEELVYRMNGFMQEYIKEGKDVAEKEHRFKCYQLFWDALEDENFFEQKEQKPVEWSEEDNVQLNAAIQIVSNSGHSITANWLKSLRPVKQEWNEEDEAIVKFYEDDYNYRIGNMPMKDVIEMRLKFKDWVTNRIKSLRPSWKPSEQEKCALRTAIYVLTDERNFPKTAAQLQNILDTFKGKESRKDWNPSEEQMEALKAAMDRNDSIGYNLGQLYEQLKKL